MGASLFLKQGNRIFVHFRKRIFALRMTPRDRNESLQREIFAFSSNVCPRILSFERT
jgi:hypothetical protein